MTDKAALLQSVVENLQDERQRLSSAFEDSRAAATDPDSKAESKYDTRSLEVSYLAAGQAKQLEELDRAVRLLENLEPREFEVHEKADLGALVELEIEEAVWQKYFLLPAGGGLEVLSGNETVLTLSPESPLCQLVLGKRMGEQLANGMSVAEIS